MSDPPLQLKKMLDPPFTQVKKIVEPPLAMTKFPEKVIIATSLRN